VLAVELFEPTGAEPRSEPALPSRKLSAPVLWSRRLDIRPHQVPSGIHFTSISPFLYRDGRARMGGKLKQSPSTTGPPLPVNWPSHIPYYLTTPSYSPHLTPAHLRALRTRPADPSDPLPEIPPDLKPGPCPSVRITPITDPSRKHLTIPPSHQPHHYTEIKERRPGMWPSRPLRNARPRPRRANPPLPRGNTHRHRPIRRR
jgi:hypothetical protein